MSAQSIDKVVESHQSRCFPLHGDALELVLNWVPTIDLITASHVSCTWHLAVQSFLHHPRHSPWLLLCHLPFPTCLHFSMHAFDPSSRTWLSVRHPPSSNKASNQLATTCFLSRLNGDRVHGLSITKMAISEDAFSARWHTETEAPNMWRQDAVVAEVGRWVVDAVVAEVGRWVVVAGGGCCLLVNYGADVRSVEVYDKSTATWQLAEPMPVQFEGSAFATWLSVAASDERLYMLERTNGLVSWFDPKSKNWGPTCQLRSCHDVSAWAVAVGPGKCLVVVGVGTTCQSKLNVRMWKVDGENLQIVNNQFEEMPAELAERLLQGGEGDDSTWHGCSVEVCGTVEGGYVYNPSEMRNGAVMYELEGIEKSKIVRRWEWVPLPERVGDNLRGRIEFVCSRVTLRGLSSLSSPVVDN